MMDSESNVHSLSILLVKFNFLLCFLAVKTALVLPANI